VNGLPATSNLYTINGENDMDPYFDINNSGANLTIGQNEIQQASVISDPYAGEYGQFAGAQVTYITKSGTNDFHGNAQYLWNGRYLNANNWISNASGTPRAFSNQNQWAASFGGPIIKNKTFFFVDNEGLRFVLPNVIPTTIPTAAFSTAVLANSDHNFFYQQPPRLFRLRTGRAAEFRRWSSVSIPSGPECLERRARCDVGAWALCPGRMERNSEPEAYARTARRT
jgi:hypothetical protein